MGIYVDCFFFYMLGVDVQNLSIHGLGLGSLGSQHSDSSEEQKNPAIEVFKIPNRESMGKAG